MQSILLKRKIKFNHIFPEYENAAYAIEDIELVGIEKNETRNYLLLL